MLYTGKQIAEQYSTEEVKITENTIRRWANSGLKHITGNKGTYLYKKEWVESYIETEAERNTQIQIAENNFSKVKQNSKEKIVKFDISNCKVV